MDEPGIYMGMRGEGRNQSAVFYRGKRAFAIFGETGLGKTARLVIPIVAGYRGSILMVDPKAEAGAVTAERRGEFSRVAILNPFRELVDWYPDLLSIGYNPLV